jgi:hypothetical protein
MSNSAISTPVLGDFANRSEGARFGDTFQLLQSLLLGMYMPTTTVLSQYGLRAIISTKCEYRQGLGCFLLIRGEIRTVIRKGVSQGAFLLDTYEYSSQLMLYKMYTRISNLPSCFDFSE